jgi:type II secretory pathway component PulK
MGVAFMFSMHLETQEARQFVATTQAILTAEAGVSYARALLDEDRLGSRIDATDEAWATAGRGGDLDVDGDGSRDARWRLVEHAGRQASGRFAVRITDEAGKANLNAALAEPPPTGVGAVNLAALLEEAGVEDAGTAARAIEAARYGPDGKPGVGGVDDDEDGAIDEADEYQAFALRGDDERFENLEDLAQAAGLTAETLRRLSRLATVYSWDLNVAVAGEARLNVNTATADELLAVLLKAGVHDPWQAAVNMADYVDDDVEMSRVLKAAQAVLIADQGPLGDWSWSGEEPAHYASGQRGGSPLIWVASVPSGAYQVRALGRAGVPVGDVTLNGQLKTSVDSGELLGTFELDQSVTIEVAHRESGASSCAFRGIELVSDAAEGTGTVVRGIEAVRFNELMIEPTISMPVAEASFDAQGSDWACPVGSEVCVSSGVGRARWTWTSALVPPGRYYVRVFAAASGQTVGEVRVGSDEELLVHGQHHPSALPVGSDGKITLAIGKTNPDETYYLKSVMLSLQPDAEYVELINLSDREIDVGGWAIEGELTGGRRALLPSGSVIKPHGLLVAAVDLEDRQAGLSGNGIDAASAWAMEDVEAVELEFPGGAPSAGDDWLKIAAAPGSPTRLLLRSGEVTVDEVEYPLPPPTTSFQSLEKGDPSVVLDGDADGVDDGWYPSLALYTPGLTNDNNGLNELEGLEVIVHDPAREATVLNRPLDGVGELAGLPSGRAWQPFSSAELAKIVDRLTVEGLRLEAEGRLTAGADAWSETADGYEHSSVAEPPVAGSWRWTDIPDGQYRLSLAAWSGERLSVRWQLGDGSFTPWSPGLSSDAQGAIVVGYLTIGEPPGDSSGEPGTPPNTLVLEAVCASVSGVCHLDRVQLDPQLIRVGPVNVNTAPLGVLRALPGMTEALAARIIAGRPYGDQRQKGRGIGDLLLGEVFGADEETKLAVFRRLAHLFTTRSDVFEIQSVGQSVQGERVNATQRIFTVVQR